MFHSVWDISISVVGQVSIEIGKRALEMPSRSWFVHGLEETKEPAKSKASIWTFISRVKTLEGDARLLYPLVKRPGVIACQILQFLAKLTIDIVIWYKYKNTKVLWRFGTCVALCFETITREYFYDAKYVSDNNQSGMSGLNPSSLKKPSRKVLELLML